VIAARPFTHAAHTARDAASLERLRRALVEALGRFGEDEFGCQHHLDFVEVGGRAARLIVVRPRDLLGTSQLIVVGFCGQRRIPTGEREREEMAAVDGELVAEMCEHPHMLCYCSIEAGDGDWHNLVLMSDGGAPQRWREGARHQWAVESLTPRYYRSIRLHNGVLPRGLSSEWIVLTGTTYYDFSGDSPWKAKRAL
jgi:hypothetical protein